jgi:S-adenosylmethionine synthetase
VDRSAAYAARTWRRTSWPRGFAHRCVIQLSYAIGVARPLSIYADTYGDGSGSSEVIEAAIGKVMDLSPRASGRISA